MNYVVTWSKVVFFKWTIPLCGPNGANGLIAQRFAKAVSGSGQELATTLELLAARVLRSKKVTVTPKTVSASHGRRGPPALLHAAVGSSPGHVSVKTRTTTLLGYNFAIKKLVQVHFLVFNPRCTTGSFICVCARLTKYDLFSN